MMVGRKAGRQDLVPPVRVCVFVCVLRGGGEPRLINKSGSSLGMRSQGEGEEKRG